MNELSSGMRIRLARLGRGWTLQDLSNRSTFSVSYLSLMERDQRQVPDAVIDLLCTKEQLWFERIAQIIFEECPKAEAISLVNALKNALTAN